MSQDTSQFNAVFSLPHGPEFRFVDQVTELLPGQSARGVWTLKGDEEFLRGHFPGQPLLPGVIMIEALAQLGGILIQTRPDHPPLDDLRLTAVRQFKILASITPGQTLHLHVQLEGAMGHVLQVSGSVRDAADQVLASGSVVLAGRLKDATAATPAA